MSSVTWFSVTVRVAWLLYHVLADVISNLGSLSLVLHRRGCCVLADVISHWILVCQYAAAAWLLCHFLVGISDCWICAAAVTAQCLLVCMIYVTADSVVQ